MTSTWIKKTMSILTKLVKNRMSIAQIGFENTYLSIQHLGIPRESQKE